MLSAILTNSPPPRARTIIRTILIAFGVLVLAMWAAVGFSVVTARQRALEDAHSEGRNLMIAFGTAGIRLTTDSDAGLPRPPSA
jgi:hypothetical protein